jgi:hypothetical protein
VVPLVAYTNAQLSLCSCDPMLFPVTDLPWLCVMWNPCKSKWGWRETREHWALTGHTARRKHGGTFANSKQPGLHLASGGLSVTKWKPAWFLWQKQMI